MTLQVGINAKHPKRVEKEVQLNLKQSNCLLRDCLHCYYFSFDFIHLMKKTMKKVIVEEVMMLTSKHLIFPFPLLLRG